MISNDLTLIISLISLGFFGGFSHCSTMCGPFVITQASSNLEKLPLEKFSNFQKLTNLALLPYHLGRISTYSIIGFLSAFLTKNINDLSNFKILSALLLIGASLFFLSLLFDRKILPFKLPFVERQVCSLTKKLSFLFDNPKGFKGYFLGLILGFIPCGLLYGAFLIAAAISNPLVAMLGMACFGIATFPALFVTALGGGFLIKYSGFKIVTKVIIFINAFMLFLMSLKLIIF